MSFNNEETVTIDQMFNAIEEAKKIILIFVGEYFGEDISRKVSDTINNLKIDIDRDSKVAELCSAYYSSTEGIYLTEKFCKEKSNNIDMIHTIIHEYAHAFSHRLSKSYINSVVEEGFANLFAEMCINNYIQKGNKINYISENDNDILLKNNGYYGHNSYVKEENCTNSIMYALKSESKEIYALREYFFGDKEEFSNICEGVFGHRFRILMENLISVTNQVGVENNTEQYLPQASIMLRNLIENHLDYPIEENSIKNNGLYHTDVDIMNAIYKENILRFEWLKKIDFSNITSSNIRDRFSQLTIEDIREITKKANGDIKEICTQYGYSDFIKLLIKGWYSVNKENESAFEEIMKLTGGIPFENFQEILEDKQIENISDIMQLLSRYHVLNDKSNYTEILRLLNEKVGSAFSEIEYNRKKENEKDTMFYIDEELLEVLAKLNLSNEDLKKILYIYSNPLSKIGVENIWNIVDVLNKIDYSKIEYSELPHLYRLEYDLASCICAKGKIEDIGLVIKIENLPFPIGGYIKEFMMNMYNPSDIFNNVGIAIETLKKYGYVVENEDEILKYIKGNNYEYIKIVPNLNSETLKAFMKEKDKTQILLNACINQFLENCDYNFFNISENVETCLMLLDLDNQNLLGIGNKFGKRICCIIQEKVNASSEIDFEYREILEQKVDDTLKRLEDSQKTSEDENNIKRIYDYFKSDEGANVISESIMQYFVKQKLSEEQVENIITFFKCQALGIEDKEQKNCEYNLENIKYILEMFEDDVMAKEVELQDVCRMSLMIFKLMHAARSVTIDDKNIETLRQIYNKLRTMDILSSEDIEKEFFANDEIKNRICNSDRLLKDAVEATTDTTTTSQINKQVSQIILHQNEQVLNGQEVSLSDKN